MHGPTHLAGGLLAGAIVAQVSGQSAPDHVMAGLAVAGLAGLVPDWIQVNLPGANSVVRGVVGHRGISHWAITALVVAAIAHVAGFEYSQYVLWGWLSHVALDLLSGGMAVLWPLPGRVELAHVKTGGQLDKVAGACCLVLATTIIVGVIW